MPAHRPLMTAATAGSMLIALWFVPSANATVEEDPASGPGQSQEHAPGKAPAAGDSAVREPSAAGPDDLVLADTGSIDTEPYLLGGTAFLGLGAALVVMAARRSRLDAG